MMLVLIFGLVTSPYIGLAAKVVIDPGHGGSDPGAIGINGLYEKTVNTEIADRLKSMLLQKGYQVVMTRDRDQSMTLAQRVEAAKAADADLFVSIHSNSHPSASIRGTMILYHDKQYPNKSYPASVEMKNLTPESRKLAQYVLGAMLEKVPNVNRGLVPSSAYVVRMGNIPSILVETAFLSNELDAQMLGSSAIRQKYAEGIANGIVRYLPPTFSDIGKHWAKDSIVRLHDLGIAEGSDGKFYPNNKLTRAELVAFVDKAFKLEGEVIPATAESGSTAGPVDGESVEPVDGGNTEPVDGGNMEPVDDSNAESVDDNGVIPAEGGGAEPLEDEAAPETVIPSEDGAAKPAGEVPSSETRQTPVFADLPSTHWSYSSMSAAIDKGLIKGYPDGTVRPNQPVTRAEVAAVFSRLEGLEQAETPIDEITASFKDVPKSYWAYPAIMRLNGQGIVHGISTGIYGPDQYVTRAQMAAMLDRQIAFAKTESLTETSNTHS
jgi:N-acetylmuramoyl-L-alanine amidase